MSSIRENCSGVDRSSPLIEASGRSTALHQEADGNLGDAPGCSNNENNNEHLVSAGNGLSAVGVVGVTENHILEELEDFVDICCESRSNKSLSEADVELIMTYVVSGYGGNSGLCFLLRSLIRTVFDKFTDDDIYENNCKQKKFFLSRLKHVADNSAVELGGYPRLKDTVDMIFCMAVIVVIGEEVGRDLLLKASNVVRNYFVSRLGFGYEELSNILLKNELGLLVCSSGNVNKVSSSVVVSLLRDVSTKCSYFIRSKYCDDVQASRSSLNPWSVAFFLRKVVVLLVLCPESLQPAIVHNKGLSAETFDLLLLHKDVAT
ncbi:hypothetical protein [Candidatus Ichthyocystis hellenicum]|uniref:hypothetical protein n=1 Tax=Candidatus Ichthyocystis hellenicum TaxID=1561003 RepID=UPI000B8303CD|nr:hypothetical protein [Candidatus Ichthyocystis hellenicum]